MEDDKISSDLRRKNFRQTLVQLQNRASSILSLTHHWKDLEDHLDATHIVMEKRAKELSSVQESVNRKLEDIRKKEKEMEYREKRLELRERTFFSDQRKEIEGRKRGIECIEKSKKELQVLIDRNDRKMVALKEIVKRFEYFSENIEKRASEIREIEGNFLEEKEKREEELMLKEKQIEERLKVIAVKEDRLNEQIKELGFKEKQIQERSERVELEKQNVTKKCKELGLKERKLKERNEELEVKAIGQGNLFREIEVKEEELMLKEKQIEEKLEQIAVKEKSLHEQCKELRFKEFKLKGLEFKGAKVELENKKVMEKYEELELKEKQLQEKSEQLELKEKSIVHTHKTHLKIERQDDRVAMDRELNANIFIPVTLDGKALQMSLNERGVSDSMRNEVFTALGYSSDPAKLVLDAMQGFYPPHLKKGDVEFEGSVVKRSCILLLEQLMRMSPEIRPHVRKEAMGLACVWITKMKLDTEHSLEVLGFLQLLASYGLASAFDADELLTQFEVVAHHQQAPELLRVMGFADKMSGHIKNLICKKSYVEAIAIIHASKLANEFPPEHLLKDYLQNSKFTARKLRRESKSLEGKIKAAEKRIADVNCALRCIENYNINNGPSVSSLKNTIFTLEKENSIRKEKLAGIFKKAASAYKINRQTFRRKAKNWPPIVQGNGAVTQVSKPASTKIPAVATTSASASPPLAHSQQHIGIKRSWTAASTEYDQNTSYSVMIKETMKTHSDDLKLKEKELNVIRESIRERSEELKLRDEQLKSVLASIEKCSEKLEAMKKRQNLVQKSLVQYSGELELKKKKLDVVGQSLKEHCDNLSFKTAELDSVEKLSSELQKDIEEKKKHFGSLGRKLEESSKTLEMKERQFEERVKEFEQEKQQFDSLKQAVEERGKQVELKEKQLNKNVHSPEMVLKPENLIVNRCLLSAGFKRCITNNGQILQLLLNEHFRIHDLVHGEVLAAIEKSPDPGKLVLDAMQGFYPPDLNNAGLELDFNVIRRSCTTLLEKLLKISPRIKQELRKEALKLAREWKARMGGPEENSIEVLGFLHLLAAFQLSSSFSPDELQTLLTTVSEHKQALELRQAFENEANLPGSNVSSSYVKTERLENLHTSNPICSTFENANSDGITNEQCYPTAPEDYLEGHDLIDEEVLQCLKRLPDPGMFVLDMMETLCSQLMYKGSGLDTTASDRSKVLILEQLMKVSPKISPQVKEAAKKLAVLWKENAAFDDQNKMDVWAFLLFVSIYGLTCYFKSDEILVLIETVADEKRCPEICQTLGFTDMIPGLIQKLLQRKQYIEAVRFNCAFGLVENFPLQTVLLKFKESLKKDAPSFNNTKHFLQMQDEAIDKEIGGLKAILECIREYELESRLLSLNIPGQIIELENQKVSNRRSLASPAVAAEPQAQIGNHQLTGISGLNHPPLAPVTLPPLQVGDHQFTYISGFCYPAPAPVTLSQLQVGNLQFNGISDHRLHVGNHQLTGISGLKSPPLVAQPQLQVRNDQISAVSGVIHPSTAPLMQQRLQGANHQFTSISDVRYPPPVPLMQTQLQVGNHQLTGISGHGHYPTPAPVMQPQLQFGNNQFTCISGHRNPTPAPVMQQQLYNQNWSDGLQVQATNKRPRTEHMNP